MLNLVAHCRSRWPHRRGCDRREQEQLDGDWRLVSIEVDGAKKMPAQQVNDFSLTFKAGKFTSHRGGEKKNGQPTPIDPTKKPKTMEIVPAMARTRARRGGADLSLEGNALRICGARLEDRSDRLRYEGPDRRHPDGPAPPVRSPDPGCPKPSETTAPTCTFRTFSATTPTTFSFEFFPPRSDEAAEDLFLHHRAVCRSCNPPSSRSPTAPVARTRERTHDLSLRIHRETDLTVVSHLTCVCHTLAELEAILDCYAVSGIENILALSGDLPRNSAQLRPVAGRLPLRRGAGALHPLAQTSPIRAASASAWPGFPRGIPHAESAPGDGLPQAARLTPAPTTSAPSCSSTTAISTTSATAATWPASACRSSPASCRSRRRPAWSAWPNWPWGAHPGTAAAAPSPL